MKIHEYQAKELFRQAGVPVLDGIVAKTPDEAVAAYDKLGGKIAVVTGCTFDGNVGEDGGGPVFAQNESVEVSRCLFADNSSVGGGADGSGVTSGTGSVPGW